VAKLVAPPSRANVNEVLSAGFESTKASRAMVQSGGAFRRTFKLSPGPGLGPLNLTVSGIMTSV
jgi:hypothetical protein